MADITMCKGTNCPLKEDCYRYTAPINEYRQSFFSAVPYHDDDCEHYWERKTNGDKKWYYWWQDSN